MPDRPIAGRRVLVVSEHLYPSNPILRRNVEHLLAQGAQVDLVCMKQPDALGSTTRTAGLRLYGLPVKHRRSRPLWYPLEYLAFFILALPVVCFLALRHRYHVVQVDTLPDFLVFVAFLARWRGARVVLFMYELMPEMTASRLGAAHAHFLVRVARALERLAAGWADHVITVNGQCRRILVARGVPEHKLTVVPNSQPISLAGPRKSPHRPILVTHATLVRRYGVQVAIRAVAELAREWPDLILEVLGEGEYRPALETLAARLGLSQRILFRGYLPWYDAMEAIQRARLGLVPILADGYGELLLPIKLLEYVAQGVPVVCSRLPAIEDHFPPDTLAYFPPGDATGLAVQVTRLLRHPEAAEGQARRARDVLRDLSWETVSRRYVMALKVPVA